MEPSHARRRRLTLLTEATIAMGLASTLAVRLSYYDVPLLLIAPYWLAATSALLELFDRIVQAASTTTHRCREAGCDFKVAVQHVDAAENRRWQEAAAAHPHHHRP